MLKNLVQIDDLLSDPEADVKGRGPEIGPAKIKKVNIVLVQYFKSIVKNQILLIELRKV